MRTHSYHMRRFLGFHHFKVNTPSESTHDIEAIPKAILSPVNGALFALIDGSESEICIVANDIFVTLLFVQGKYNAPVLDKVPQYPP